jgi:hypothetical protein
MQIMNSHRKLAGLPRPVLKLAVSLGLLLAVAGCGSSATRGLEGQMKEMNSAREKTAKFAGTVTIDGKLPRDAIDNGLYILLYDPKKPPAPSTPPLKMIVDRETGRFVFTTYAEGDGVPVGSYYVLFVALKHTVMGKKPGYHEPDALKNLYNDPDQAKDNPELNVTVSAPGKSNYAFDLKLEGHEQAVHMGPNSVTQFVN